MCDEKAIYGYEILKPTHCGKCKTDDMKNVINDLCISCQKVKASYGYKINEATHCIKCEPGDMIYVLCKMVCHEKRSNIDFIYKKCCNCNKVYPSFGMIHGKPTHCSNCKTEDMLYVLSKTCQICKKDRPLFGFKNNNPTHCFKCKTDDMKDVFNKTNDMKNSKSKQCFSDWCDTLVGKKYNGYCYNCFVHLFPDEPTSRIYKKKETEVVNYFKKKFFKYNLIFDKVIDNACSKRRPDIFLDLYSHIIIIEIDENQHNSYDEICENKRLMELSQDLAHRPIIFLRFNPDSYINEDNEKVRSPWRNTKKGASLIKESIDDWNNRLKILETRFEYWIENVSEKTITLEKLFFTNGY